MNIEIRRMAAADLEAVYAVQCRAHPGQYHEPVEALASRLALGLDFCLVAVGAQGVLAYFLAHPWHGNPPPLHENLSQVAAVPERYLFLHDLAVSPECRGEGVGRQLCTAMFAAAAGQGLAELRLVAVGHALGFWQRHGFVSLPAVSLHASYGAAMLMRQRLPPALPGAGY